MVEDLFRTMKSVLETRRIYHKRDETIRGHVFCSFLALVLQRELDRRFEQKELEWEWAEILRGLNSLQEVEAAFRSQRFVLRGQLMGQAHTAFQAAGVAFPRMKKTSRAKNVAPRIEAYRLSFLAVQAVTGRVGDATLTKARLKKNRGALERRLNVKTDFIIVGELQAALVTRERITRSQGEDAIEFQRWELCRRPSPQRLQIWRKGPRDSERRPNSQSPAQTVNL